MKTKKKDELKLKPRNNDVILIGLCSAFTKTCFVVFKWNEKKKHTHKYIYIDIQIVNLKMT